MLQVYSSKSAAVAMARGGRFYGFWGNDSNMSIFDEAVRGGLHIGSYSGSPATKGGNIHFSSSGKMGIGTDNPQAQLHIGAPSNMSNVSVKVENLAGGASSSFLCVDADGVLFTSTDPCVADVGLDSAGGGGVDCPPEGCDPIPFDCTAHPGEVNPDTGEVCPGGEEAGGGGGVVDDVGFVVCPDGTTVPQGASCPDTVTWTSCPDGSMVISGQACPLNVLCPDGKNVNLRVFRKKNLKRLMILGIIHIPIMQSGSLAPYVSGLCVVALSRNLKLTTTLNRAITQNPCYVPFL
jgi:hypothetical protein